MFSVLPLGICAGKKILFGSLIPPLLSEGGAMPFENVIPLFQNEEFLNSNSIKPSVEPLEAQDSMQLYGLHAPRPALPGIISLMKRKDLEGCLTAHSHLVISQSICF